MVLSRLSIVSVAKCVSRLKLCLRLQTKFTCGYKWMNLSHCFSCLRNNTHMSVWSLASCNCSSCSAETYKWSFIRLSYVVSVVLAQNSWHIWDLREGTLLLWILWCSYRFALPETNKAKTVFTDICFSVVFQNRAARIRVGKGDNPVTYEHAHAPHHIAHRKGWLSQHTSEEKPACLTIF